MLVASVKKFTESAVVNILRHNRREILNDRNKGIDPILSSKNYYLTPDRGGLSEYEYYKQRKSELYCYKRSDVKVLAGWVCTVPKELVDPEEQKAFFRCTRDFLVMRYGVENTIQIAVHYDEGKFEKVRDSFGRVVRNEQGEPVNRLVCGQPHLHFCFIPVTADKNPQHLQKEKICANEVLTHVELCRFHEDYQRYLDAHGIRARVVHCLDDDWCQAEDGQKGSFNEKNDMERLRAEIKRHRQWATKQTKKGW